MDIDVNALSYGIEIEGISPVPVQVGRYHRGIQVPELSTGWNLQSDTSIVVTNTGGTPMELVSPVLKGPNGLHEVKKACNWLSENRIAFNSSCGLHIHVGWDYGTEELRQLIYWTANLEKALYAICGSAQRERSVYCRSVSESNKYKKAVTSEQEINRLSYSCNNRRHILNVTNIVDFINGRRETKPTVEYRQFPATNCYEVVISYVRFAIAIVEKSLRCQRLPSWQTSAKGHRLKGDGATAVKRAKYLLGWIKGWEDHRHGEIVGDGLPTMEHSSKLVMKLAKQYDREKQPATVRNTRRTTVAQSGYDVSEVEDVTRFTIVNEDRQVTDTGTVNRLPIVTRIEGNINTNRQVSQEKIVAANEILSRYEIINGMLTSRFMDAGERETRRYSRNVQDYFFNHMTNILEREDRALQLVNDSLDAYCHCVRMVELLNVIDDGERIRSYCEKNLLYASLRLCEFYRIPGLILGNRISEQEEQFRSVRILGYDFPITDCSVSISHCEIPGPYQSGDQVFNFRSDVDQFPIEHIESQNCIVARNGLGSMSYLVVDHSLRTARQNGLVYVFDRRIWKWCLYSFKEGMLVGSYLGGSNSKRIIQTAYRAVRAATTTLANLNRPVQA